MTTGRPATARPATIRPATLDDARAIAVVHVLTWQAAYRDLLPADFLAGLSVDGRERMWTQAITQGRGTILVAEVDGVVAGFCSVGPCVEVADQAPGTMELWTLYVAPEHWSTGLGRELWLAARRALQAQGAEEVILWVLLGNERAIRFYLAAGFELDLQASKRVELPGAVLDESRYVLRLVEEGPS